MFKAIKTVVQIIWVIAAIALGVTIGAAHGWQHHGLVGAIALGFVGLCAGAVAAASPSLVLQFLRLGA